MSNDPQKRKRAEIRALITRMRMKVVLGVLSPGWTPRLCVFVLQPLHAGDGRNGCAKEDLQRA